MLFVGVVVLLIVMCCSFLSLCVACCLFVVVRCASFVVLRCAMRAAR